MDLSLSNVINVSVSAPGAGIGLYNTSNIGLFTREAAAPSFGLLGYRIYLDPSGVATDFGTSSNTYAMATAIFSQQPNILANGGYLVIMPFLTSETIVNAIIRTLGLVQYFGVMCAEVTTQTNMLAAASEIQTLNKLAIWMSQTAADVAPGGMLDLLRTGSLKQNRGWFYGAQPVIAVQNLSFSSVSASGAFVLNYNGNPSASIAWNASAATIQTDLQAMAGLGSVTVSGSIASQNLQVTFTGVDGPALPLTITSNTLMNSIPSAVVVTDSTVTVGVSIASALQQCLVSAASYWGRALSTNFNGSDTTQTMHLKDLIGVQPDPSMTQTLLNQCQAAGADVYASIQGVPKVFTSGANDFFDNQYNLQWFVGGIQVAGFNVLAQTSTKIPQTDSGMDTLKTAYRNVCEQGVTNQFLAPGQWNNPTTFGNQADLLANVSQRGYYIYSAPVSQQSPAVRATRAAPLVQIAIKYAGAIHSSSVIVNINP